MSTATQTTALIVMAFILGVVAGSESRGSAQKQFQEMSSQDRVDFIYAMATPEVRRAIAEDWCAISYKTRRVCRNARLAQPIKR